MNVAPPIGATVFFVLFFDGENIFMKRCLCMIHLMFGFCDHRYPGLHDAEATVKEVRSAYQEWLNSHPGGAPVYTPPEPASM